MKVAEECRNQRVRRGFFWYPDVATGVTGGKFSPYPVGQHPLFTMMSAIGPLTCVYNTDEGWNPTTIT